MKFREQYRTVLRGEAVDIAYRVLVTEGDAAVTMRRVSEGLGLSPSAIYRYFKSRDDLIAAVWRRRLDEIGDRLTSPPTTRDPATAVDAVVTSWVDAGHRDPQALLRIAEHLDDAADGARVEPDTDVRTLTAPLVDALRAATPARETMPPSRSSTQAAVILRTIAAVCAQPETAEPPNAELAHRAVTAILEAWSER